MHHSTANAFKYYGILAIKLIGAPAGIIWLISKLLADPHVGYANIDPWLLAAALVVNQVALMVFAIRMRWVLITFSIFLTLRETIRIHLQSMFYFFVLPMTVGLEAARFAKIKKAAMGNPVQSATLGIALLTDRLIGAFAALLISLALWPFVRFHIPAKWQIDAPLVLILITGLIIALAFLLYRYRRSLMNMLAQWQGHFAALLKAFIVSLTVHVLFCLGIFLAARSISIPIELHQALFVISAAMLFVVLPISFAGAGPIEVANIAMLLALGMSMEQAVAFTLLSYLARLVAAFEGGVWEIWEGGVMAFTRSR